MRIPLIPMPPAREHPSNATVDRLVSQALRCARTRPVRSSLQPALFCLAVIAALVLFLLGQGCGFPAALARTHTAAKKASSYIEPPLAAECLKRAKVCADAGKTADACPPLTECRGWKALYVLAAQRLHQGAAGLNRLYDDLKKVGVIK